jgi:hypothetical protein
VEQRAAGNPLLYSRLHDLAFGGTRNPENE